MFKFLGITLASLILTTAAFSQLTPDSKPCEMIKGKSYLGWNEGKWDPNTIAVNSHRIIFDKAGKGTSREFFVINDTGNASQIKRTVECKINTSQTPPTGGKSYLLFGDGSILYITSYDHGAKLWGEVPVKAKPTKGWLLQLPPPPPPANIFPF